MQTIEAEPAQKFIRAYPGDRWRVVYSSQGFV